MLAVFSRWSCFTVFPPRPALSCSVRLTAVLFFDWSLFCFFSPFFFVFVFFFLFFRCFWNRVGFSAVFFGSFDPKMRRKQIPVSLLLSLLSLLSSSSILPTFYFYSEPGDEGDVRSRPEDVRSEDAVRLLREPLEPDGRVSHPRGFRRHRPPRRHRRPSARRRRSTRPLDLQRLCAALLSLGHPLSAGMRFIIGGGSLFQYVIWSKIMKLTRCCQKSY